MHGLVDINQFSDILTPGNFNWFLYTLLFYHTKYDIHKPEMKNLGLDEELQDDEDN